MKKIRITICVAVVLVTIISCNKFVNYNPHEDYVTTADDYFKSSSDYQALVVGAYAPLGWIWANTVIGDVASDNAASGGESASVDWEFDQIDNFLTTPNNSKVKEAWVACYEGINRVNYLDENKGKLSFAGKDSLYGQAYFLRAFYYFELVKMFGDVPLFVDHRLTLSDNKALSRTPKANVYKQMEIDLKNAVANLPVTQTDKGRATKYSAEALLGKVYLYENKYDSALAILEKVINSGAFSLVTNFGSIFLQAGENGPESVFEIQYSNAVPFYDWTQAGRGEGNLAVQSCGVRNITGTSSYAPGWSLNLPTKELSTAYSAGDSRKASTILDIEAFKIANPSYGITYKVAPYKNTGLYNQKYQPRQGESSGQIELNYLNNFRTIRYADVLLMAAEANNRASTPNDTKAQAYLNMVRARAYGDASHATTATGTTLKQAIWDERRLELAMEGDRFFDLVRTGQAATKLTGFKVGKNELFPIPQQEIDNSGLAQNPGY